MATVLETGGGAVSQNATKKCTVSFKLTKSVMLFSGTVQLSTTGLSSTDSDAPIIYAMSILEKMENAPKIDENAEDGENEKNSDADDDEIFSSESLLAQLDTVPRSPLLAAAAAGISNAVASAYEDDAIASTSTLCDTPAGRSQQSLFPNAQFFSTSQQRTRAKKRTEPIEADNNSNASSASNSTKRTYINKTNSNSTTSISSISTSINRDEYYEKKAILVEDEIKRRAEWHKVCIELKQQELLVKQKELTLKQRQAEFWAKAASKLDQNLVFLFYLFPSVRSFICFSLQSIGDISNLASNLLSTSTSPIQYEYEPLPQQQRIEIVDEDGAHVQFVHPVTD